MKKGANPASKIQNALSDEELFYFELGEPDSETETLAEPPATNSEMPEAESSPSWASDKDETHETEQQKAKICAAIGLTYNPSAPIAIIPAFKAQKISYPCLASSTEISNFKEWYSQQQQKEFSPIRPPRTCKSGI